MYVVSKDESLTGPQWVVGFMADDRVVTPVARFYAEDDAREYTERKPIRDDGVPHIHPSGEAIRICSPASNANNGAWIARREDGGVVLTYRAAYTEASAIVPGASLLHRCIQMVEWHRRK